MQSNNKEELSRAARHTDTYNMVRREIKKRVHTAVGIFIIGVCVRRAGKGARRASIHNKIPKLLYLRIRSDKFGIRFVGSAFSHSAGDLIHKETAYIPCGCE
jgi:hypothetical protein